MDGLRICKILEDAGAGEIDKTIFLHEMPASCQTGLLVRLPMQGVAIDPYLPGYFKAKIQVIARSKKMENGRTLIESAVKALSSERPQEFNNADGTLEIRINRMIPATLPISYPRGEGGAIEWSVSFETSWVLPQ